MKTSFWTPYISDSTVKAICWTLIHSLWIGMIIALLTGLVITLTRKSGAALRYRLLCGILVLFVLSVSVTYLLEAKSANNMQAPVSISKITTGQANNITFYYADSPARSNFINDAVGFLNQNMNIIFLVWALFFILKSLKMVSGLLYIQRIRNYKVHEVTEELKHRIEHFSSQIGIRRAVCLVQSELVKVPVAIGWLKPMILLPVGIAFQLTPEQLDGILWHELAHICRRDYLVNILQGLVETVFFFNPGLLWLSSLIRTEREACCDDMVLSRMNSKANYLEALLSFSYGEFKQAGFAMSLGSGNQLRDRLKRMIEKENKRLNMAEKTALVVGLIALSAFTSLPKTAQHAAQQLVNEMTKKKSQKIAPKTVTIDSAKQGTASQPIAGLNMTGTPYGKVDSLAHLSSTSYKKGDYNPVTMVDITAEDIHGKKYHLTLAGNKLMAIDINGVKIKDSDLPEYQPMVNIFKEREKAYGAVLANKLKAGENASPTREDTTTHFFNLQYRPDQADKNYYTAFAKDTAHNEYKISVANNKLIALTINGDDIQKGDLPKYAYLLRHVPSPPPPPLQPASPTPSLGAPSSKADTLSLAHLSMASYRNVSDKISTDKVNAEDNHGKNYHFIITNDKVTSMNIDGEKIKDSDLPKYQYMVRLVRENQRASEDRIKKRTALIPQPDKPQQPQEPPPPAAAPSLDKMIADVTNDLINEHIIKDKSSLVTVKLTYAELIVNGVKQPDDIQKKFAAKYYPGNARLSKDPNYGLYYNARTHGVALGTFNIDLDAL